MFLFHVVSYRTYCFKMYRSFPQQFRIKSFLPCTVSLHIVQYSDKTSSLTPVSRCIAHLPHRFSKCFILHQPTFHNGSLTLITGQQFLCFNLYQSVLVVPVSKFSDPPRVLFHFVSHCRLPHPVSISFVHFPLIYFPLAASRFKY